MQKRLLAMALVAGMALFACSRSGDNPAGAPQDQKAGDAGMNGMGHGAGEGDDDFGAPAEASEATRMVTIQTLDTLRFQPSELQVREGEVITFSVTNPGAIVHELALGNEGFQRDHAAEMMARGSMMKDTLNAVLVEPGETKWLTWKFTAKGEGLFGCHQPGHYEGGMVGKIVVS